MTQRSIVAVSLVLAFAGSIGDATPSKKDPKDTKKEATPPPPVPPPPTPVEPPAPPPGDKRRIVGVLDIRVDGVPAEIAAQFQQNLEARVDTKQYWLAGKTRVHEMLSNSTKWTEGCVIGQCLGEVKTQVGADLVLLVALTGSGTSFGFVVTLVRTDTGRVLAQGQNRCDVCTINQALNEAIAATVELLKKVPDKLPDDNAGQRDAIEVAKKQEEQLAADHHHRTRAGMAMTIAGLVVAVAGSAVYFADNHVRYGLAAAAAGGGLAAGGVVVLTF